MNTPDLHEDQAAAGAPLPRASRRFVVLVALVQGLLLYLAAWGDARGWGPFGGLGGRVCWYALVLSVPSVALLSVQELRDRRFWEHIVLVALLYAAMAAWAAWSVTGAPGLESWRVLAPFALSAAAGLFVALPYLQCRQAHGRWCAPYPELFEHAWQNALTLVLTGVFVGVCWLVLVLWAGLFELIGIAFFQRLFSEQPFIYLVTGAMVGLGILIGRTQHGPVRVARRIVFAICTGLLPLLALVAVLFVLSLPFTGLAPLWRTPSAATILLALMVLMVLFTNAVVQDGGEPVPYPRGLRWLVNAGLVSLPVFAVLAVYALWLRIDQYGWTAERLAGLLVALVLAGHGIGYAWAALRRGGAWLAGLRAVNVGVAIAAMLLVLLVNSPLLDPHRLAVNDQLQRLRSGRTPAAEFDVEYLRFAAGRRGHLALQGLAGDPWLQARPELAARVADALDRTQRYREWKSDEVLRRTALTDVARLREVIDIAKGSAPPGPAWWQALAEQQLGAESCLQAQADCVALQRDLDGDGVAEVLLCDTGTAAAHCTLAARDAGRWREQGEVVFAGERQAVRRALRDGDLVLHPRRWPELEVAGRRAQLRQSAEQATARPTPQH